MNISKQDKIKLRNYLNKQIKDIEKQLFKLEFKRIRVDDNDDIVALNKSDLAYYKNCLKKL